MNNILRKTRYKIFFVSPKKIKYCLFPSKFCDYTQFNSTKLHPHGGKDRGVFKENVFGNVKIIETNWDKKFGILFSELLEFKALKLHYYGKENWKISEFAERNVEYIRNNNKVRGFSDPKKFLINREKQIDRLIQSISKKGVYPINSSKNKKLFIDNISLALTRENKLYFNNRGHHRLSIAKILGLKKVPIKITVAKSLKNLLDFYDHNNH